MKKIEFGYSNSQNPTGSMEGIGIKPGLLLVDADYYGAVRYEDDSFVIAKVTADEYGHYPELVGNFIVRPAIADLFVDGSGIIFLDQEQSEKGHLIESFLNNPQFKDIIKEPKDVFNVCSFVSMGNNAFTLLTMPDRILATSIQHDVFELKNEALKKCHHSFSEMQINYEMNMNESKKM